jgi:hypothetical protein
MQLPGIHVYHESTVRSHTWIGLENAVSADGQRAFAIRVHTCDVCTHEEVIVSETQARARFERVVEAHELEEAL